MSIGLTKEELEARNNDSLIKYIGVLQTELTLIYSGELPRPSAAIEKGLDFSGPDTLKSTP
jgi:hypothetical protein